MSLFRSYLKILTVSALTFLFMSAALPAHSAERNTLKIGDPPPRFSAPDLEGRTVTLPDDAKGRILIVHFWADWCKYCLEEMPALDALYREHKGKGVIIYAVNVGQTAAVAGKYIKQMNISYPVLVDTDSTAASRYGVKGLPRTFFIDRSGLIRYKLLGEASGDMLKKLLAKLL